MLGRHSAAGWRKCAGAWGRRGPLSAPLMKSPLCCGRRLATLSDGLLSYMYRLLVQASERNSMRRRETVRRAYGLILAIFLTAFAYPSPAQESRGPNFLAQRYEVSAYLDTAGQTINSIAKVELRAQEASQVVRVELHQNMEVREVKGPDGKPLS